LLELRCALSRNTNTFSGETTSNDKAITWCAHAGRERARSDHLTRSTRAPWPLLTAATARSQPQSHKVPPHAYEPSPVAFGQMEPWYIGSTGAVTPYYLKYGTGYDKNKRGFWYRNESVLRRANGEVYPLYASAGKPHDLFVLKQAKQDWSSSRRGQGDWGEPPKGKGGGKPKRPSAEYYDPWHADAAARFGVPALAKKPAAAGAPQITRCEFDGEVLRVDWNDDAGDGAEWTIEYAPTWWPAAFQTTVGAKGATLRFPDGGDAALQGTVEVRVRRGAACSEWRLAGQPCARPHSLQRPSHKHADGTPKVRLAATTSANC
jgi:hypothetical protein